MSEITIELHSGMAPEEWDRAMAKLEEVGFATAEKKGGWKHRKNWSMYVCDQCSFESREASRYCPNCGAKMEE